MKFRWKTIIGIAVIEAALLLVLILSSLQVLRSTNEDELRKRAYTSAQLFASSATDAVVAMDLASLNSILAQVLKNPGIVYARVRGDNKVLVEGGDPQMLKRLFKAHHSLEEVNDGVFDAYADISIGGENYGRVEIGFSVDSIKTALSEAQQRFFSIAAIEMLLVALFSYILGRYLTRGLDALKTATTHIAQGDFGYQLEVRGKDELADTAHAFNKMARTLQETTHRATHDALTHLPNRSLFYDRLNRLISAGARDPKSFAIAVLDLDQFKTINDTRGHHTGDRVLEEAAKRLLKLTRDSDTVARLGGDEFALLLLGAGNENDAKIVCEKIISQIRHPFLLNSVTLSVGVSIGIALFPLHGKDAEGLMHAADTAMYHAKKTKSGFVIFQVDLDKPVAHK